MESVWSESVKLPQFAALNRDIKTDVLIIGGGMAGLLCAYMLERENIDYVLVEADTICSGITKNTTAKITSQHGLIYDKLIQEFGAETARMYLEANQEAIRSYRRICAGIDCGFEPADNYIYSVRSRGKLEREMLALDKIKCSADLITKLPLPVRTAGAVRFRNQAQFNPLKFVCAIAPDLNIYEHTRVMELAPHTAITTHGKIRAENMIIATHFPMLNKHGSYFMKMYQQRSYVIALENLPKINGMYRDEAEAGLSFRSYQKMLLLGGGSHRTGKPGGGWRQLEAFAMKNYPGSRVKYRWATQDCMTLDSIPYIGQYSSRTDKLYVATGFNKWGMTSSMVSAKILTDMIAGRKNPYARAFSPSRTMLRKQLFINMFESCANLMTFTKKRCPHLGCALKWNREEHSWDCPCHGSRFTEDGRLIDNPATGPLK